MWYFSETCSVTWQVSGEMAKTSPSFHIWNFPGIKLAWAGRWFRLWWVHDHRSRGLFLWSRVGDLLGASEILLSVLDVSIHPQWLWLWAGDYSRDLKLRVAQRKRRGTSTVTARPWVSSPSCTSGLYSLRDLPEGEKLWYFREKKSLPFFPGIGGQPSKASPFSPPCSSPEERACPWGFREFPPACGFLTSPAKMYFLLNVILTIKLLSCSNTFLCTVDIWDY